MMDQQELRELENRCIQEHAPFCTAACPIHVDVRGMIAAIQQGDFVGGLKILRKTMPFPGIISHICNQPCQLVCKRSEAGDAIAIADLEKACVIWGKGGEPIKALPPKPKRVAVVGGGLSGLTVAYDLARKGYRITIFEEKNILGGKLWDIPFEILPWSVTVNDLEILEELEVEILLNTPLGKVESNGRQDPLAFLCKRYDAVYLGIGADIHEIHGLLLDAQGQIKIDPVTYMTNKEGVFAGGGILNIHDLDIYAPQDISQSEMPPDKQALIEFEKQISSAVSQPPWRPAILSVMDGRRAATSIDRRLQKVSLTAARSNEGAYTTRLYTSMQGITPLPVVPTTDLIRGYSKADAIKEAQRCILCECMECVKVCEYLEHFKGYPKKYIREIYNNLSIVMGTRYSNKLVNSCSLCGLCGEICPEDLDMGRVCKEARQTMVQQKRMPPSAHDFALRDMAFSNSNKFALARNQPGTQSSQYAFFPGCQLCASSPDYVYNIYEYLREQIPHTRTQEVGLILRCCGAPADWAGRLDLFQAAQVEFMDEYERMGQPKLVLACSSCYQVFKNNFPDVEIISLWEIIDQFGLPNDLPRKSNQSNTPLAIHDPCSTRYESHIQESARNILQRLGYAFIELPLNREKTECCSYGGLMWLANPELAEKVTRRRISESPEDYVTYCAMCRDFFVRQGKPTLHLLDLIYGANPQSLAHKPGPGYSQRHENRIHLKRKILKQIWEEDMENGITYENIRLIITPEVQNQLENRLILIEDIQQVIDYAERSGKKLLNKKTNRFLAYHKPGAVTYWVEYTPEGNSYVVYKAYSHRMEIREGSNQ
ncbi:MAG: FAD-dependent oxidoreductase [Anaerolineales bacterium]|nr:FAD-dependent oxidoreductase [Anaerolineales bacterium]